MARDAIGCFAKKRLAPPIMRLPVAIHRAMVSHLDLPDNLALKISRRYFDQLIQPLVMYSCWKQNSADPLAAGRLPAQIVFIYDQWQHFVTTTYFVGRPNDTSASNVDCGSCVQHTGSANWFRGTNVEE